MEAQDLEVGHPLREGEADGARVLCQPLDSLAPVMMQSAAAVSTEDTCSAFAGISPRQEDSGDCGGMLHLSLSLPTTEIMILATFGRHSPCQFVHRKANVQDEGWDATLVSLLISTSTIETSDTW
eukprot:3938426-Rhodomonas_salina.4